MTTRSDTIDLIRAKLELLSDDQLEALADIASSCATASPPEGRATLDAIAEGVAQAKAGLRSPQAEVDALLKQPWR